MLTKSNRLTYKLSNFLINDNNLKFSITNNKAFSLIELSIVLIIMGLLTAGIMGGSNLIWSAKIRSTISQYYEFTTGYNAYYARDGKVPNENPDKPGVVYERTGLKDLYEKGFISGDILYVDSNNVLIRSKINNNSMWGIQSWGTQVGINDNNFSINILILGGTWKNISKPLTYKEALSIENKIDDNNPSTGKVIVARVSSGGFIFNEFGPDDNTRNTALFFYLDII